jgi:preprotein translocase subunit SecD
MSRNTVMLIGILLLALVAGWVDLPSNPGIHIEAGSIQIDREIEVKQGLDLQGGLQVLLEADLAEGQELQSDSMDVAAQIIENRVNSLGVVEPLVQTQGDRRIIVELPGVQDPEQAIATLKETGLLEFIDAGDDFLPPGIRVETTYPVLESEGASTGLVELDATIPAPAPTPATSITPTQEIATPSAAETTAPLEIEPPSGVLTTTEPAAATATTTPITPTEPITSAEPAPDLAITDRVFATVLTGAHLETASVQRNEQTGQFLIAFEMTEEGGRIFEEYTGRNINKYLSIVLDKVVISSPVIRSEIPDGRGVIEGDFGLEEARNLVIQLRYGSLPVPLRVETTRSIGPSLGQDSVAKSIRAGTVGLLVVLLFMLTYYRLPGLLADLALVLYGLLNFAVYKAGWPMLLVISLILVLIALLDRRDAWPLLLGGIMLLFSLILAIVGFAGVTLTLPAITGFILSTGMAVDANILVFERMKEELRAGRTLAAAMEAGFNRAWTSIRDSNISTLITCGILYYFGSNFGASAVQGFAVTLAFGVVINIFTAITVTRTFVRAVFGWFGETLTEKKGLLGV